MREETFVTDQEAEASNYLDPISGKPLQVYSALAELHPYPNPNPYPLPLPSTPTLTPTPTPTLYPQPYPYP